MTSAFTIAGAMISILFTSLEMSVFRDFPRRGNPGGRTTIDGILHLFFGPICGRTDRRMNKSLSVDFERHFFFPIFWKQEGHPHFKCAGYLFPQTTHFTIFTSGFFI